MNVDTKKQAGFGAVAIIAALLVVAVLGFVGWRLYGLYGSKPVAQRTATSTTTNNQTSSDNMLTVDQSTFKIPGLGVEFDVTGGITPLYLYSANALTWDGISYQSVPFSTQQFVDKGAAEANGGNNVCSFSKDSSDSFPLTSVLVFNSTSDALTFLKANSDTHLTTSDMTMANGFFTIGGKLFYVPQGVSGGLCLQDTAFKTQQWEALHQSLMTLKAIR